MLTPQMIDAMNRATGNNVPLDGSKPVKSRADEIRDLGKQGLAQTQPPADQGKTNPLNSNPILRGISDVAGGVDKSIIGTAAGVMDIGKKVADIVGKVPGLSYLKTDENSPGAQSVKAMQGFSKPANAGETVGKTAGDIAQFFIPGGAEAEATGAINKAVDTAKFAKTFGAKAGEALSGILKSLGHAGVSAASAGAVTAAQTGGDPTQTAMGAAAGGLAPAIGKVVESAGKGVAKLFIPKSDAEAGMLQAYKASTPFMERVKNILGIGKGKAPTTAASTAFDKGLIGTESMLGVQAKRAQAKLWTKLIKPALDQSEEKVDIPSFLAEAEKKITGETNDPTRLSVLKNALESITEDFGNVKDVSLAQLQKYKEGWAEFVPEKAYKGQPIAGAVNDVRNTLAGMARQKIYNTLGGNVKQAYLDYGNLHGITALGRKAMTGAIKGGTGTTLKNLLEMTTIPIGTVGGQTLYKVGQGIELFGKAGATTVRDVLGIGQD